MSNYARLAALLIAMVALCAQPYVANAELTFTPTENGGSFSQSIIKDSRVTVGDIPAGVTGLNVSLTCPTDVDIELYDGDVAIVAWNIGLLNSATPATYTYKGMVIEYSGFNGVGGLLGNEYIRISGTTTTPLRLVAFGYAAGTADVVYSYTEYIPVDTGYTLTYTADEHGTIAGEAMQTVNHGDSGAPVTAIPDMGYHFTGWSDGVSTATRTDSSITGNLEVSAGFAVNQYALEYTSGPNGSITGIASQQVDYGGSGTEVTAVPDAGYHFVRWSDGLTTPSRTDSNVTANLTLSAVFEQNIAVTVSAEPKSKTYGNSDPELTYQVTSGSLAEGDSFSGVLARAAGEDVGTYDIQQGTLSAGPKYDITFVSSTLSIVPKGIDATAVADDKTYDGMTAATGTITLTGVVGADDVTATGTFTFADANAGLDKTVDVTGIILGGTKAGNYTLEITSTITTADITKADITGVSFVDSSVTYNGAVKSIEITGTLPEGACVSYSGNTGTDAGTYNATATITGGSNYNDTTLNATLTINKADISGISFVDSAVTYDGTVQTIQLTGTLPEGASVSYSGNTGTDAGTYNATATITGGSNYNDTTLNATLTINKADISGISFVDSAVTYDGTVKTIQLTGTLPEGASVSYSGNTGTDAGTYNATATITGGSNYNNTALNATLVVSKAVLTATVGDYSRTYGDENPEFAVTVNGFVNGETAETAVGYIAPTASSAATFTTGVGPAAIDIAGGTAANYTFNTMDTGILTIDPKALTATAVADDKTYDGTTAATGTISLTGVVGTDDVTAAGTFTFADASAGLDKAVDVTGIILGGTKAGNYTVSTGTIAEASIYPASLTIKVNDQSKTYGDADPELTVAYSGFVSDDDASAVTGLLVSRVAGEDVLLEGYTITATGAAADNYAISCETGTLTIERAPLAIKADDQSKTYGDADPELTVTYTGFKLGDDYSVVTGLLVSREAGENVSVEGYPIIPTGAAADNYTINCETGTLTITQKRVTATGITARSKYYDGTTEASLRTDGAELIGTLTEDDVALDAQSAAGIFEDGLPGRWKTVTVTGLVLTGADSGNYILDTYTTLASIITEEEATPTEPTEPTTPPTDDKDEIELIVNGERQEGSATAITTTEGGQTVTTVVLDSDKLGEGLQQAGENPSITIPVNTGADVVVGMLTGQMVKDMESQSAVLEVRTDRYSYTLPAQEISIDAVGERLGENVSLQDVTVHILIAEPESDAVQVIEDTASQGNYALLVPPLEFSITCTYGDQTVEVSRFEQYVERLLEIPEGIDPERITTGIVVLPDGSFSHVPTMVTVIDGRYYAKINSLTNSTYSVIWNPLRFEDMAGHWAEQPVNDMASRLIMDGDSDQAFGPDIAITRREFAVTIVKALGLKPGVGENPFSDITPLDEFADYIITAHTYGLMNGYPDGTFRPENTITREEAMSMVTAAMRLTGLESGLQPGESAALLTTYADSQKVGSWAQNVVAACLKSGIIGGRPGMVIAPKDNISRAETAAIMQRLLRRSGLI